jgi:hypothetical protein
VDEARALRPHVERMGRALDGVTHVVQRVLLMMTGAVLFAIGLAIAASIILLPVGVALAAIGVAVSVSGIYFGRAE